MRRMPLTYQIFIGMVVGLILGTIVGGPIATQWLKPFGDIFIRLIRMLVVPLVFFSLAAGAASLGDITKLGRIGGKILGLYIGTTVIASTLGLIVGNMLQPGAGLAKAALKAPEVAKPPTVGDMLINIFPLNPVDAMARADMLQIIVFALFFGVAISMVGERASGLKSIIEQGNEAMLKLVGIVMAYAPIGVAALMAWVAGAIGFSILVPLAVYLVGVIVAIFLHGGILYSLIVAGVGGVSPVRFYKNAVDFMLVAFTTCSSAAALPLNMQAAEKKMGVPRSLYGFTLPLGATVNMDGTAIYMGVATVLIAQFYGISLTFSQQLTVILTATLASIGAAGVPGAGLVMMSMVLTAVGLPLEGIAIIAGVDRIADMFRTTLNVTGDAACTVGVARTEGMLDKEVFYGRKVVPEVGAAAAQTA
ncbi:MAG: dicarboxylate/amino acid:cation symporter [Chloroflexi bacterium]|nr:dicarboxylate/amino acid:cation symporter [Chloroflexota bacterium]